MSLYIYYVYLCLPWAAYRILRGESGWAKTTRNSQDLSLGSMADKA
jgi:hypothetical protein